MQPTYLPWLGYFDLIDKADIFVFLDSVQFDKRSWQQRNRIKTSNGELMLTVPVLSKSRFEQKICDVMIDNSQKFEKKHFNSIRTNYHKSTYFDIYAKELSEIYRSKHNRLADLNILLIKWLSKKMGITSNFKLSSQLNVHGFKVDALIDICKKVNGDHYLSPSGSIDYINNSNIFPKSAIKLSYQTYQHPIYSQLYGEFIPFMSAVDLLFNEGEKSLEIIVSSVCYD